MGIDHWTDERSSKAIRQAGPSGEQSSTEPMSGISCWQWCETETIADCSRPSNNHLQVAQKYSLGTILATNRPPSDSKSARVTRKSLISSLKPSFSPEMEITTAPRLSPVWISTCGSLARLGSKESTSTSMTPEKKSAWRS